MEKTEKKREALNWIESNDDDKSNYDDGDDDDYDTTVGTEWYEQHVKDHYSTFPPINYTVRGDVM